MYFKSLVGLSQTIPFVPSSIALSTSFYVLRVQKRTGILRFFKCLTIFLIQKVKMNLRIAIMYLLLDFGKSVTLGIDSK